MRIIQGDGNDFYRAVGFSALESAAKTNQPTVVKGIVDRMVPHVKTMATGPAIVQALKDFWASIRDGDCDVVSLVRELQFQFVTSREFDLVG